MTIPTVHRQEEAARAVEANTTPRSRKLSLLRAYVRGDQYDGRKKWWDKSVPVWEREPCVIWMAAQGAITSNEDLLLGEGRYPTVTSRPDEDNGDDDELLDEDSSELLDKAIKGIELEADLRAHNREQYCNAQSVGTAVGIFGARHGRLFADCASAEFCTAKLDHCGDVVELEIKYPYLDIVQMPAGEWVAKAMLFRRVIDTQRDVTYLPGEALPTGKEPLWKEDPALTTKHGLGFCPVVHHKFRCISSIVNEVDGNAIHGMLRDEMDAFNLEASIRHEAALFSMPQKYEIGVQQGYNPTADKSPLIIPATRTGGRVDPINNPQTSHYTAPTPGVSVQGSRRQGPGSVWQYDNPEAKVGQLELNPGALEALSSTMADLRARICETLAWVALNPEEIKFAAALSGKALERLMARQLNRVAKDRDGFGRGYLLKSYCMLLRIAQKLGAGLKTRGLKKALPVLTSFVESAESGETWTDPPLALKWGTWFQPLPEDDKLLVETATMAYEKRAITRRSMVEKLSRTFSIEDVNAYLEALKEEEEERAEREAELLADGISKMHAGLDDSNSRRRGADSKANAPGGGGGAASAAGQAPKSNPGNAKPKPG